MLQPGDGKRARFESRCCPQVFSESDDCILSVFRWERLRAKLQDD